MILKRRCDWHVRGGRIVLLGAALFVAQLALGEDENQSDFRFATRTLLTSHGAVSERMTLASLAEFEHGLPVKFTRLTTKGAAEGIGTQRADILNPIPPGNPNGCSSVFVQIITFSHGFLPPPPPSPIVSVTSGSSPFSLLGKGSVCGSPSESYTAVAFDASQARTECDSCAVAAAQAWSDGQLGILNQAHINDFGNVTIHGSGVVFDVSFCYTPFCERQTGFFGDGAAVEIGP